MKGKSAAHKSLEKTLLEFTREHREKEIQEAEHRKQLAIARQMKADGVPAETVAKYTGLTLEEIAKL